MYLSVCVCVCLYVRVFLLCARISLYVCMSVCDRIYVCMSCLQCVRVGEWSQPVLNTWHRMN